MGDELLGTVTSPKFPRPPTIPYDMQLLYLVTPHLSSHAREDQPFGPQDSRYVLAGTAGHLLIQVPFAGHPALFQHPRRSSHAHDGHAHPQTFNSFARKVAATWVPHSSVMLFSVYLAMAKPQSLQGKILPFGFRWQGLCSVFLPK